MISLFDVARQNAISNGYYQHYIKNISTKNKKNIDHCVSDFSRKYDRNKMTISMQLLYNYYIINELKTIIEMCKK